MLLCQVCAKFRQTNEAKNVCLAQNLCKSYASKVLLLADKDLELVFVSLRNLPRCSKTLVSFHRN